jgi:hypothetical protein
MSDLPALAEIPTTARRKLLAALRGIPARGVSEQEMEAREEKRVYEDMMLERFRAECPSPRAYRDAVRAWRQNHRNLRFIQKIAALVEEQRREEMLGRFFELAVLRDLPPRKIVDDLGMRLTDVTWRLKCAREDVARHRRGEPTRREIAATLRARYWREMKEAIERSRDPETGKRRKS